MKQTTSLLERLKICWYALTMKNYIFFALGKEPIIWKEDGKVDKANPKQLKSLCYVDDTYKFKAYGKETTLHDFTWGVVEKFAKEAQEGKY